MSYVILPRSTHVHRMHHLNVTTLQRILKLLVCALIGRVVIGVGLSCADYMPPNFEADFLQGREPYFFGSYQWSF